MNYNFVDPVCGFFRTDPPEGESEGGAREAYNDKYPYIIAPAKSTAAGGAPVSYARAENAAGKFFGGKFYPGEKIHTL